MANINGGDTNATLAITNTNTYSQYWLVGAYNPLANPNGGSLGTTSDYMKLSAVAGTVQSGQVPEPGSIALMAAAIFGMAAVRRRKIAA